MCKINIKFSEQKLIDDLIIPTGISSKPNENQLKEFAKRCKSLDRDVIFKIIVDKLSNYENMSDPSNSKTLNVFNKFTKLEIVICSRTPPTK